MEMQILITSFQFVVLILLILLIAVLIEMVLMYLYFRFAEWKHGREEINLALQSLQERRYLEEEIRKGNIGFSAPKKEDGKRIGVT